MSCAGPGWGGHWASAESGGQEGRATSDLRALRGQMSKEMRRFENLKRKTFGDSAARFTLLNVRHDLGRCLTSFSTCSTHLIALIMLPWNFAVYSYRDVQYVPSTLTLLDIWPFIAVDMLVRYWQGERHSLLINCTVFLLACDCQNTSIAWLTHQFKVAWFVGCPATIATPHQSTSLLFPATGIEAFSHAWEVFSSQHVLGSITLRWP